MIPEPWVKCSICAVVIDINGDCSCKSLPGVMSSDEYTARYTHPSMRRSKAITEAEGGAKH
jgi:hypothetical protein